MSRRKRSRMRGPRLHLPMTDDGETCAVTASSSSAASITRVWGSTSIPDSLLLSITVRRVSNVVPAPRVGAPVDRRREYDARGCFHGREGRLPSRIARDAARRRDGDQPPARSQRAKSRANVPEVRVTAHPVDARRGRERRVHEHDVRPDAREAVGDGLGVVAGDACLREQVGEEAGPDVRDLVQVERAFSFPSAHCAITASIPVPAEGSRTTSPARSAAARTAA